MLKFYDVDPNYTTYLQTVDSKVPNISYGTNNKFVCGVVLNVNGYDYFAPVSHLTDVKRTSLPIYNHGEVIATIRFSFMFPAPMSVLTQKDFRAIGQTDRNYANLLHVEQQYCVSHTADIYRKAHAVYQIGCNPNHKFHSVCCNFPNLEHAMLLYNSR